jgi:hypothetical protein
MLRSPGPARIQLCVPISGTYQNRLRGRLKPIAAEPAAPSAEESPSGGLRC